MASSDYYWSRRYINGFGKMWFLIVPQQADANGGGLSLLGSVVNEVSGSFPFGRDYPEPIHLTTPQLILSAIDQRRGEHDIPAQGDLILQQDFPGLSMSVEKEKVIKAGVGHFPGIPINLSVDYSKVVKISVTFGANTRKRFIPRGLLSGLKNSVGGNHWQLSSTVNIDKEFIIHEVLLTDQYSVSFESETVFGPTFEAAVEAANAINAGNINAEIDQTTHRSVTVNINDGNEYLIALKNIDWDDF